MSSAGTLWIEAWLLVLLSACSACGGMGGLRLIDPLPSDVAAERRPLSPAHVQLKGSHNSYHRAPRFALSPQWRYTHPSLEEQLESDGVRQLELDVRYERGELRVEHLPLVDGRSSCRTLRTCFSLIRAWSKKAPRHLPVFVFIEPKEDLAPSGLTGRIAVLDSQIARVFPRQAILSPDDVAAPGQPLREAIMSRGWPSLAATRGKVAFVLFGADAHKRAYLREHQDGSPRWMFVAAEPHEQEAAIWLADDPIRDGARIRRAVGQGFLVRTRADAGLVRRRARRDAALASGAHFIATDFIAPALGWLDFDGRAPVRCNPITAPSSCNDGMLAEREIDERVAGLEGWLGHPLAALIEP